MRKPYVISPQPTSGWGELYTDYDKAFVDEFKANIPHTMRRWNRDKKCWEVRMERHLGMEVIIGLCTKYWPNNPLSFHTAGAVGGVGQTGAIGSPPKHPHPTQQAAPDPGFGPMSSRKKAVNIQPSASSSKAALLLKKLQGLAPDKQAELMEQLKREMDVDYRFKREQEEREEREKKFQEEQERLRKEREERERRRAEDAEKLRKLSEKTLYSEFGITEDATQEEIKKAYRMKAIEFHPDRNKADGATEKFLRIKEIYATLSDPERRKRYDASRKMSLLFSQQKAQPYTW